MAKNPKAPQPQKSPAPVPGASPSSSAPAPGPGLRAYRVNWHFQGFRPKDLFAGDMVEATEEEASTFTGPDGVLTLVEA